MNANTVNAEVPATDNFEPHFCIESGYRAEPERSALCRPVHDRMLTGVDTRRGGAGGTGG